MRQAGMPAATAPASSCIGLVGEVGAGREPADDDTAAAIEASSLSTCADTAGADLNKETAGFFAGDLCAAGFFAARSFEADFFAAGFFAAVLKAAFAPTFVIALPGALAATFLAVAGKATAALVADLDTLAAFPALPAVLRDFVETAMVFPESGQQCDDQRAGVIASCISRFGLSN